MPIVSYRRTVRHVRMDIPAPHSQRRPATNTDHAQILNGTGYRQYDGIELGIIISI